MGTSSGEGADLILVKKVWDARIPPQDRTDVPVFLIADGRVLALSIITTMDPNGIAILRIPPTFNPDTAENLTLVAGSFDENGLPVPVEPTDRWLITYGKSYLNPVTEEISITITNAPLPKTVSVSVEKAWDDSGDRDGLRPGSVSVQLLADGAPVGDPVTIDADGGWAHTWEGLLKYGDDGHEVAYSVEEVAVPECYAPEVTGDMAAGFTVTNTHVPAPETVSVPVSKVWVGGQGGPVKVRLLADGKDAGKSLTLDEASGWRGSFDGLPRLGGDGKAIAYTVAEDVPAGYSSEVTGDADSGFTVTNTRTPDVPGSSSHDGDRPIPKTGDRTGGPLAPMAAAAASLAMGAALLALRGRRSRG